MTSVPLAIAILCHENNRALCQAFGDDSQAPWDAAPEWQKASTVKGVQFHLDHPEAGPEAGHESWMEAKLADGWVYGETKDADKKTHPCLVAFDELPAPQRAKDFIFRCTVHALARQLDQLSEQHAVEIAHLTDCIEKAAGHLDIGDCSMPAMLHDHISQARASLGKSGTE